MEQNSKTQLSAAVREIRKAHHLVRRAEAVRNDLLVSAHAEGATLRELAEVTGTSAQRIGQILEGVGSKRKTLHEAMVEVLQDLNGWLPAHRLAQLIYEGELYRRRDRGVIPPGQVRARAAKYPELFETTIDGSGQVRLRASAH